MRIDAAFPSTYLKAADLNERDITVTINDVKQEEVGDDSRPVVYFRGAKKGLVLNKTNATTIAEAYGNDTDDWFGKPVTLYEAEAEYQGKRMPAIRVRIPKQEAKRTSQAPTHRADELAPQERQPASQQKQPFDDEIPF